MGNILIKHDGINDCVATRRGCWPGLCFKSNDNVYNIISTPYGNGPVKITKTYFTSMFYESLTMISNTSK